MYAWVYARAFAYTVCVRALVHVHVCVRVCMYVYINALVYSARTTALYSNIAICLHRKCAFPAYTHMHMHMHNTQHLEQHRTAELSTHF